MNDHNVPCGDERLLELLHSHRDSDKARDAAAHLEHCPRCQERLEALAAQPQDWRLAHECLAVDDAAESNEHDDHPRSIWATMRWQQVPSGCSESMAKQLLAPPSHPEMLGRIGRYEVERVIGAGGMGVVFKAFDTELNRPVAVKVLAPYLAGSGAARKRFAREARAAAAIVHEHVVAIHNVETEGNSPFLVMHYVAGESLQQRLDRQGWLELCEILRIGLQTAAGLAAAHAQGLVHRDVKPSNILLEQGIERTLLTDFGLARASDDASVTFTGHHPGTPQYMSPEQARGEAVDARSDLFSLGSVLYAMCAGRPPFRAETTYGVLRKLTDSEPRPIRDINPAIPEWLCGMIDKLISKQQSDRYQSAMEVAELLEECLAHVQQPTTVPLPKSVGTVVANRNRRPPLVRLGVAAAFAFLLIFAGVLIVLELNKGKLTIQCEADDVPIRIMQGGDVVENLSVSKSGKTVRIAAGRYRVEVDGDFDSLSVEGGDVSLKSGGVETVRIQRLKAVPGTVASSSGSTSDEPNLNRKPPESSGDGTVRTNGQPEQTVELSADSLTNPLARIAPLHDLSNPQAAAAELPPPESPELFPPFELRLAHFEPGPDRTESTLPGSQQTAYLDKKPIARLFDVSYVQVIDDAAGQPAIEIHFGSLSAARRVQELTQSHLNKPVAMLVDGKLLSAPTIREPFGGMAVIAGNFTRDEAERIVKTIRQKIEQIDANVKQVVSDVDAGPVWGEAVDGLQLGVSGIRQDRRFKPGDTIRFRLHVRNVGTQTIRFEYKPSKTRDWIAPTVERTDGTPVEWVTPSLVRGGHRHFTETLEPGDAAPIHVVGILVLGTPDSARSSWPCIEKPEPGEYRLRGGYYVELLNADGKPIVQRNADGMRITKSTILTSGTVTIHID